MFRNKGVQMSTWHYYTLSRSLTIDVVVVSLDLRPHVLDTHVKSPPGGALAPMVEEDARPTHHTQNY